MTSANQMVANEVLALIEKLAGQGAPLPERSMLARAVELIQPENKGLGHGQFNELLLSLGFDRVSHGFFQYLVDGKTSYDYEIGAAIKSLEQLREGVNRFRTLGLHLYGNVKFAFKNLSANMPALQEAVSSTSPRTPESYASRHDPIRPIDKIPSDRTYFLGYIVKNELEKRLKDPNDAQAAADERVRSETVAIAKRNHETYLVSDHLDVYVATSMREPHEYQMVHELSEEIFSAPQLRNLKVRYFDPTQAYCNDRIDKGLAEALMLKRAKCTIYVVGESDTLGKDSELACTLAQGKPVIAYVPQVPSDYAKKLLARLERAYPKKKPRAILLEQLQLFDVKAAWRDEKVRQWLANVETFDWESAVVRLQKAIEAHYDTRAYTLKDTHPLGIQVNLSNGVANGVLVVREVRHCAEIVKDVLLNTLKFQIEERTLEGITYLLLRERWSQSIFRVVTGDKMLMNAFWNFYLAKPSQTGVSS